MKELNEEKINKAKRLKSSLLILSLGSIVVFLIIFMLINSERKLRVCPENWNVIESGDTKNETFLYKGENISIERMDMNWFYRNCNLEKEIVY